MERILARIRGCTFRSQSNKFFSLLFISAISMQLLASAQQITGFRSAFGPSGSVKIANPTLEWKVWAGQGCKITSTFMAIDGIRENATYNSITRFLTFRPSQPLDFGQHQVRCEVTIDHLLKMKQNWDFTISQNAISNLHPVTPQEDRLFAVVDAERSQLGLSNVNPCRRLIAAAQAHSHYLSKANTYGHFEMEDIPSFVGQSPADRLNAFGWITGGYEDVGYEPDRSAKATVRALYDAPYHRIPFMQPGTIQVGVGAENHRTTIEFGFGNQPGIVVSPANGQISVPRTWNANESPNPLRIHSVQGPVGYPIIVAGFGKRDQIETTSFSLQNSMGRNIPCFLNTPQNDSELHGSIIAIPKAPLSNGLYQARAFLTLSNGDTLTKKWNFTVGSQEPLLSEMKTNEH